MILWVNHEINLANLYILLVGWLLWFRLAWLISNWLAHAFVVSWQISWRLGDLRWPYSHVWHLTGVS